MIFDPEFLRVPFRRHVHCDNLRHLVQPDVVGIDPCLAVTKSMDVIVRLKDSAVVKDKLDSIANIVPIL